MSADGRRTGGALPLRLGILALGVAALIGGLLGGLGRLALPVPLVAGALSAHGALLVSGFFGTVITLERAVAVGGTMALVAPAISGAAGLALAGGSPAAAWLLVAASLALIVLSLVILRRQLALHTALLTVAATAWLVGNALFAAAARLDASVAWWFAFLVLTIAAERLELTRLMRRRANATPLLLVVVAWLLAAAAAMTQGYAWAYVAYGGALVALAAWLFAFDLARRTVRTQGVARYAAVALLAGYGWLAAGGCAFAALPEVPALRDLALHAIGLGFVLSMVFAHAPIVVPVISGRAVVYTPWLYAPLALLHGSLLLRVALGPEHIALRQAGSVGNALAIVLFAATLVRAMRRRRAAGAART